MPGAGAGAGAAEQFYSELEPEPESECFPGAGAGAGADQKCHGSASLIFTRRIVDGKRRRPRPDGDSWAVAKAAADRDVCVVRGMQLNFNFQKTGAQAEIVWLFIFQSLLVVPYRTIE